MCSLSPAELLPVWERGADSPPAAQAALLLAAACPETPPEELARLSVGQRDALLLELRGRVIGSRLDCRVECPACQEPLEWSGGTADLLVKQAHPQRQETPSATGAPASGLASFCAAQVLAGPEAGAPVEGGVSWRWGWACCTSRSAVSPLHSSGSWQAGHSARQSKRLPSTRSRNSSSNASRWPTLSRASSSGGVSGQAAASRSAACAAGGLSAPRSQTDNSSAGDKERMVANDPSSATRHTGRSNCKPWRHAGFAAAHG
jgi:hypothetical protein